MRKNSIVETKTTTSSIVISTSVAVKNVFEIHIYGLSLQSCDGGLRILKWVVLSTQCYA